MCKDMLTLRPKNLDLIKREELPPTVSSSIPQVFMEHLCTASGVPGGGGTPVGDSQWRVQWPF